jgi:hypothetical protein
MQTTDRTDKIETKQTGTDSQTHLKTPGQTAPLTPLSPSLVLNEMLANREKKKNNTG